MEPHKAAILAALSLADQLFQTRRELKTLQSESTAAAEKLTAEIAAKLASLDLAASS
jgi:hypothetical protein